jgi:hypothetical protein
MKNHNSPYSNQRVSHISKLNIFIGNAINDLQEPKIRGTKMFVLEILR